MKTLLECLAEAKTLPFKVEVVQSGGEFKDDWDVLEITRVGTKDSGPNKGQLTYDFTVVDSSGGDTGATHRQWRHTSEARFELKEASGDLPKEIEDAIYDHDFGGHEDGIRGVIRALVKVFDLKPKA